MKTLLCAIIVAAMLAEPVPPALAAPPQGPPAVSLFFTPAETAQIAALAASGGAETAAADLSLGAVIYYGPNDWSVWLQGACWTPVTAARPDLRILGVAPDLVRLMWTPQSGPPRTISLRAHQTYQIATGKIVEGSR
ncbi:MAG TPA: hypothetical protein VMV79_07815 [Alphaproteobacteria bacterium]|nr:hypothetical protein [Alphaproteobacteria bacterium]